MTFELPFCHMGRFVVSDVFGMTPSDGDHLSVKSYGGALFEFN